jgi:hypothetical protein
MIFNWQGVSTLIKKLLLLLIKTLETVQVDFNF